MSIAARREERPVPRPDSAADTPGSDEARRRDRSIRSAVYTSVFSKVGSLVLQFAAMPVAARVLGKEDFGIYATVSLFLTMMILLELGLGPALAQGISRTAARNDREGQSRYFTTGLFLLGGMALLASVAGALVVHWVPLPALFGAEYAGRESVMLPALWVGLAAFAAHLVLDNTVKVREGFLETNISNTYGAVGNLLAATTIAVGIFHLPHAWFMIVAIFGCSILVRAANTVHLVWRRPHLLPHWRHFDRRTAGNLVVDGMVFSTAHALPYLVEVNFSALVLGRIAGPGEVALFLVFVTISTMFGGLVLMIAAPTWPAVVDAWTKGDRPWVFRAARRLYGLTGLFSGGLALTMVLIGPWLIPLWYGDEFRVDRLTCALFSLSCVLRAWRYANHALVVGIGRLRASAAFTIAEVLLSAGLVIAGASFFGLPGVFGGQALAILLLSGWGFPWIFWRGCAGPSEKAPSQS